MNITETDARKISLALLQPNEGQLEEIGIHANPRQITEDQYQALKASMQADNLTGAMPLKVYEHEGTFVVLGGNMRLRALKELGLQEVACIVVPKETDAETLNKIIITDNSTFGDWDMDALANWNEPLDEWGVDMPTFEEPETKAEEQEKQIKLNASEVVVASVSLFGQTGETIACLQLSPEQAERLLKTIQEQGADSILKKLVA